MCEINPAAMLRACIFLQLRVNFLVDLPLISEIDLPIMQTKEQRTVSSGLGPSPATCLTAPDVQARTHGVVAMRAAREA